MQKKTRDHNKNKSRIRITTIAYSRKAEGFKKKKKEIGDKCFICGKKVTMYISATIARVLSAKTHRSPKQGEVRNQTNLLKQGDVIAIVVTKVNLVRDPNK